MAEYIERETAIKNIKEHQCRNCSDIGLCENCAVLTAIKLFENITAVDVQPMKWIPVTERLPKEMLVVLCYCSRNGQCGCGEWTRDDHNCVYWIGLNGMIPTHWMPLPEPPKEET